MKTFSKEWYYCKSCLLLLMVLATHLNVVAQGRVHKGFYLSVQAGPTAGKIMSTHQAGDNLRVSGNGAGFDLQVGGSLKENLILHATLSSKSSFGPEINHVDCSNCIFFDESFIGAGLTYYTSANFLFTVNLGAGNFSLDNSPENLSYTFGFVSLPDVCTDPYEPFSTRDGPAFQLKAGKEWWLSNRIALGLAGEYGFTRASTIRDGAPEKWHSHRLSIRLTATLHGKRQRT